MKSPDEIMSLIARSGQGKAENARFVHSDNVVGVLGDFPELTQAVREGDVQKISVRCGQLFVLNSVPSVPLAFRSTMS
jgi:hypothetical protein